MRKLQKKSHKSKFALHETGRDQGVAFRKGIVEGKGVPASRWQTGRMSPIIAVLPSAILILLAASQAFAQGEAHHSPVDYRDIPYMGSRNLVWVFA